MWMECENNSKEGKRIKSQLTNSTPSIHSFIFIHLLSVRISFLFIFRLWRLVLLYYMAGYKLMLMMHATNAPSSYFSYYLCLMAKRKTQQRTYSIFGFWSKNVTWVTSEETTTTTKMINNKPNSEFRC